MQRLFALAPKIKKANVQVLLVQIDEAHSSAWPMGLPFEPSPQKTLDERCKRARYFVEHYGCPYPVFVDTWENTFANTFHAWPDKFYFVDSSLRVIDKSKYGQEEHNEALLLNDYTQLLEQWSS